MLTKSRMIERKMDFGFASRKSVMVEIFTCIMRSHEAELTWSLYSGWWGWRGWEGGVCGRPKNLKTLLVSALFGFFGTQSVPLPNSCSDPESSRFPSVSPWLTPRAASCTAYPTLTLWLTHRAASSRATEQLSASVSLRSHPILDIILRLPHTWVGAFEIDAAPRTGCCNSFIIHVAIYLTLLLWFSCENYAQFGKFS
jgi:hypothetical protein